MKPKPDPRQEAVNEVFTHLPQGTKLLEVWAMSGKGMPKELLIIKVHRPDAKNPEEHHRFLTKRAGT